MDISHVFELSIDRVIFSQVCEQKEKKDIHPVIQKYGIVDNIIDLDLSDVLLWTPTYGRAKAGRPARTYIQQLCEDRI